MSSSEEISNVESDAPALNRLATESDHDPESDALHNMEAPPDSPSEDAPISEPLRRPVPVAQDEQAQAIVEPAHVCQEDSYNPEAVEEFVRIVNESLPRIGPELVTPNVDRIQAQELIESIKCKPNDDPGPSTVIPKPAPEQDIFSKPTEYEEEFLLTENMVNSYIFSDESKSTDCSSDDSPTEDKTATKSTIDKDRMEKEPKQMTINSTEADLANEKPDNDDVKKISEETKNLESTLISSTVLATPENIDKERMEEEAKQIAIDSVEADLASKNKNEDHVNKIWEDTRNVKATLIPSTVLEISDNINTVQKEHEAKQATTDSVEANLANKKPDKDDVYQISEENKNVEATIISSTVLATPENIDKERMEEEAKQMAIDSVEADLASKNKNEDHVNKIWEETRNVKVTLIPSTVLEISDNINTVQKEHEAKQATTDSVEANLANKKPDEDDVNQISEENKNVEATIISSTVLEIPDDINKVQKEHEAKQMAIDNVEADLASKKPDDDAVEETKIFEEALTSAMVVETSGNIDRERMEEGDEQMAIDSVEVDLTNKKPDEDDVNTISEENENVVETLISKTVLAPPDNIDKERMDEENKEMAIDSVEADVASKKPDEDDVNNISEEIQQVKATFISSTYIATPDSIYTTNPEQGTVQEDMETEEFDNLNTSDEILKEIDNVLAEDHVEAPQIVSKPYESNTQCSTADKTTTEMEIDLPSTSSSVVNTNNISPLETKNIDRKRIISTDSCDKNLEATDIFGETSNIVDEALPAKGHVSSAIVGGEKLNDKIEDENINALSAGAGNVPCLDTEPAARPSEMERQQMDLESSDEVPVPEDTLGLFAEARMLLREDDEEEGDDDDAEEEDDDNNDDDESNQMAPDSSEVESNAPANDIQDPADIDQSDGDQTNQSEQDTDQLEEEIERPLLDVERVVMEFDDDTEDNQFGFLIASIASAEDDPLTQGEKIKEPVDDTPAGTKDKEKDTASVLMDSTVDTTAIETSEPMDVEQSTAADIAKVPDVVKITETAMTKEVPKPTVVKSAEANKLTETEKSIEDAKSTEEAQLDTELAKAQDEGDSKRKENDMSVVVEAVSEPPEVSEGPVTPTKAQQMAEEKAADTPSKTKKLDFAKPGNVMNIVDLGSSSDSDDVQEIGKMKPLALPEDAPAPSEPTTSVNIPRDIDIMCASGGGTSSIVSTPAESVISGIPAATPPKKVAPRINTSEITIKTAPKTPDPPTITIPDEVDEKVDKSKTKVKHSLEVFNIDSDEEDTKIRKSPRKLSAIELQAARDTRHCINYLCRGGGDAAAPCRTAPGFVLSHYEVRRSRRCSPRVCEPCFERVARRTAGLMEGLRGTQPLLSLDMEKECQEFVEISDSDSDSEGEETPADPGEKLSPSTAKLLEEELASMLNESWRKYGLDERLRSCEDELRAQLRGLEKDSAEIDDMLAESQKTMDQLRNELYSTFASEVRELDPVEIDDTPPRTMLQQLLNQTATETEPSDTESRRSKRQRKVVNYEETSVRSPIPLSYAHIGSPQPPATVARDSDSPVIVEVKLPPKPIDDSGDVSVVELSAEAAPAGLPPPGALERPAPRVGDAIFAMRQSAKGTWVPAKVLEVTSTGPHTGGGAAQFLMAKIRFDYKKGSASRQLSGRQLAYIHPSPVRLPIATRVIALFKTQTDSAKRDCYYSGIIAETPTPVNSYRYLVFFDDGYAQYVPHSTVRIVCEASPRVWDDVHPDSRDFVRKYLLAYPERPMVRLQTGQALKTEYNGKWWVSRVVGVDASLVQVLFEEDGRAEWIYRGSTRLAPLYLELQASQRQRPRGLTRLNKQAPTKANMPYVEYTRTDEQEASVKEPAQARWVTEATAQVMAAQQQRAVAKKSTATQPAQAPQRPGAPQTVDNLMTRVVYYSPKAAVRPLKMVAHECSPACRRTDVLPMRELKTYNPLTRPLLTGWERHINRFKGKKVVTYRSPCGRIVRDMRDLHRYLRAIRSEMGVDLFDFNHITHCLAEFVLNKCYVSKKDLSHGKENVPVPCVNYYDGSLPEFCLYNTERTPTAGVPLNLDPEFLCGCDCTDDCQDKSKCACWKLTLEGAKTIGLDGNDVGYHYKRLPEPLPSGIYECNSRCKCAQTCLNRVAQHPLQLKLQVFKTFNRGWGIRALNDVPKGAFLCVYAGNLLTDATANLDGVNEGDEYLAELDYIEVVERMKEGYESDVQDDLDRRKKGSDSSKSSDEESEEEEERENIGRRGEEPDLDFRPDYVGPNVKFTKSLRKRKEDKQREKDKKAEGEGGGGLSTDDDQFITISDDEEVREPSRFTAQTGLDGDDYKPRHLSVRTFYGKDEACYIMDAKVQGNIGRYLNHSCQPNVFVQNVFVDTHDPRFPWVAFFALCHVQAGSELTWNYNYDVGSVPDKVMYCKCGAPNCRGRLL